MREPISPRRSFPVGNPDLTIARVTQGLTLYIRDSDAWASRGATLLFDALRTRIPDWRFRWWMTSTNAEWRRVDPEHLDAIRNDLGMGSLLRRVRHLFEFRIGDEPGACHAGMTYREVDEGRGPAGYAQVFLPRAMDSDELLAIAIELGHELPFLCAVGGVVGSWSRPHAREAFAHFHAITRRYMALDVQVPWMTARHVHDGLPGVGWITMIGNEQLEKLGISVDDLRSRMPEGVAVMPLTHGCLVRAGELVLGDVNQMEVPSELAAVACYLDPYLLGDEAPLPGPFAEEGTTSAWRHRFAFPEAWT